MRLPPQQKKVAPPVQAMTSADEGRLKNPSDRRYGSAKRKAPVALTTEAAPSTEFCDLSREPDKRSRPRRKSHVMSEEAIDAFLASESPERTDEADEHPMPHDVSPASGKGSKKRGQIMRLKPAEGGPWCWQRKTARRMIRTALDGQTLAASVLGVYDALTELASDCQSDLFQAAQAYIASHSGFSLSQVKRCLKELKRIGLIKIQEAPQWDPSKPWKLQVCTYTLLEAQVASSDRATPRQNPKSGAMTTPSQNQNSSGLSVIEESKEESLEDSYEQHGEEPLRKIKNEKNVCSRRAAPSAADAGEESQISEILSCWKRRGNPEQDRMAVRLALKKTCF